jgi:triosephosphate isomerase
MRKQIVAGNWKMNKNASETKALIQEIIAKKEANTKAEIVVAPTFINLSLAVETAKGSGITVAAQNMHQKENGAYTGEISADMITSIGIQTVILGHSERRAYFGETDSLLAEKVNTALKHNLRIIFCFGEELKERKENTHFAFVESQLKNALFHLTAEDWKNIVLAYEPVWAIGTGETASPDQAQEMHAFIRQIIATKYGNDLAEEVTILYGGSVKPDNAKEIFGKKDVDGGLIGGASLNTADFLAIVNGI